MAEPSGPKMRSILFKGKEADLSRGHWPSQVLKRRRKALHEWLSTKFVSYSLIRAISVGFIWKCLNVRQYPHAYAGPMRSREAGELDSVNFEFEYIDCRF